MSPLMVTPCLSNRTAVSGGRATIISANLGMESAGFPKLIVSNGVVAIAAGGDRSLFLKSDGSLWGMGYNSDGGLGDGTTNNAVVPVEIVTNDVIAIAARGGSLFLKSDGSL